MYAYVVLFFTRVKVKVMTFPCHGMMELMAHRVELIYLRLAFLNPSTRWQVALPDHGAAAVSVYIPIFTGTRRDGQAELVMASYIVRWFIRLQAFTHSLSSNLPAPTYKKEYNCVDATSDITSYK